MKANLDLRGSGFLGRALTAHFARYNHQVLILTWPTPKFPNEIQWDAKTTQGWLLHLSEMDAVINVAGFGLEHWLWTQRQKQRFIDSHLIPGRVLEEAFEQSSRRLGVFIQISGINRYGLRGKGIADESTPASDDFLGQTGGRDKSPGPSWRPSCYHPYFGCASCA